MLQSILVAVMLVALPAWAAGAAAAFLQDLRQVSWPFPCMLLQPSTIALLQ